ncbi:hypothetical protein [Trichloromonas sp.]|uniref:hypothetical protein n=1 Tax=Trichloromonas sp. TaxID=3069249 RepID=UPI003D8177C7
MSADNDCSNLVPIDEAATQLGTTELSVLMHIKRKLIAGQEIDGQWFIDGASLDAYAVAHGGASRSLCRSHCSKAGGCGSSCG